MGGELHIFHYEIRPLVQRLDQVPTGGPMKRALIYTLMAVLAGCLGAVMATAQATDGNIVGAVKDPSGALVPNVSLTLESMTTGVKHTATSDNSGAFRFSNIMVGTYKLSAKATGFTEAVLGGVVVELNQ